MEAYLHTTANILFIFKYLHLAFVNIGFIALMLVFHFPSPYFFNFFIIILF